MCEIIKGLGGSAPAPEKLSTDPFHFENNIRKAVDAGARLGVQPILTAKDMANPEVEHLGIMAYAAHLQWVPPSQSVRNCTQTMDLAQREFGVPKVLEPEYLASPWLDELSGMTYLSYFMKPGGPGYNATMRWVNTQVKDSVKNFTVSGWLFLQKLGAGP